VSYPVTGSTLFSQLETVEAERRCDRGPDEGVTAERPGPLPDAGVDDELRRVAGADVGSEDLDVDPSIWSLP
jgi:hypothetical protein